MLDDVDRQSADKTIDLAVFSGDLADEGKAEHFALARKLLIDPMMERFELEPDQVVLAPGNHDVNRGEIRDFIEQSITHQLTNRAQVSELLDSPGSLAYSTQRLKNWTDFHHGFYGESLPDQPGPLAFIHNLTLEGHSLGIAALNSAWRSASNKDRGKLLLGNRQVESALSEISNADLRIVVVHHPLSWLAPFDAEHVQAEFENRGVIVLSGHEHKTNPIAQKSPYGEALYLSAGCLYEQREYPNSFEIIDVDVADRKVLVHFRRWQDRRREFDADLETAPEGSEEFDLPSADRRKNLGHPRFSVVMRSIAETAQELRVVPEELTSPSSTASIESVLIEPRFLKVTYAEAEAAATLDTGISSQETDPLDFRDSEGENPGVILVAGPSQSGVSSSLLWLLAKWYRLDVTKMPALLKARDSGLGTTKEGATLAKASALFGHKQSDARDPELLLAIDDFEKASERKQELIVDFIRTNHRHRYVVGCHEDWSTSVAMRLENAGIPFQRVFLGPFGIRQLRQLASTLASTPTDIERINGMISKQRLPRTPFTMIALLAVVDAQRDTEPDLNESALLEAYVNLLLGSGEPAETEQLEMNFRKRVHLLGEFARAVYTRDEKSMAKPEAEQFLLEYFGKKGLRPSAGDILRSLISRSILLERNGQVAFRHPALLHLFMGHWMHEGPDHRGEILDDCGENADVLRHAAGLKRNDKEILAQVTTYVQGVITALAPVTTPQHVDEILEGIDSTGFWQAEQLGEALSWLPQRGMVAEIDARGDRIADAFSRDGTVLASPRFETARELNEAVSLLSDVLKNSELVDDVNLKKEALETAISGWILLIGVLMVEDANEESFRDLITELVTDMLDDHELSEEESKQVLSGIIVTVVLFVVSVSLQGRLGSWNLSAIVEAALDDEEFTASATSNCLVTWLHAHIGTAGWPRRLEKLLETLPADSLLRDATLATTAHLYRASQREPEIRELEPILIENITPAPDRGFRAARKRNQLNQKIAKRLQQSRRAYQRQHPEEPGHGMETSTGTRSASRIT